MVHDGVEPTWHSLLDTESYSLRVAQADMPRVPEILKAVPQADIDRMRANLAKVWRRCVASAGGRALVPPVPPAPLLVAAAAGAAGMGDRQRSTALPRLRAPAPAAPAGCPSRTLHISMCHP